MNASDHWDYLNRQSEYAWEKLRGHPLFGLWVAASRLATLDSTRYQDDPATAEMRDHLRGKVGQLCQNLYGADAQAALDDLSVWRLVLRLYSRAGLSRLEARAEQRKAA